MGSDQEPQSRSIGLDYFLENLLCGVPERYFLMDFFVTGFSFGWVTLLGAQMLNRLGIVHTLMCIISHL